MKNKNNLVGRVFGRLTVIEEVERAKGGHVQWKCLCSCGKEVINTSSNLLRGKVVSCGCYAKEMIKDKNHQRGLRNGWMHKCKYCGKEHFVKTSNRPYCSDECSFLDRCKEMPSGCIEWQGNCNANGYGVLRASINGNERKMVSAHRYAWYRVHGNIPADKCLCHKCDNPKCVNEQHLFLGTWYDNNHDRSLKGRSGKRVFTAQERERYSQMFRGENSRNAKLTEKEVFEIRDLKGKAKTKDIAIVYGVSESCIEGVLAGRSWKHLLDKNDENLPS